jgi:hypothetical protein
VAVQVPLSMFVELSSRSNMRFLKFDKSDLSERTPSPSTSLMFLYREAFMSGKAFSPSMLDTLVYQVHSLCVVPPCIPSFLCATVARARPAGLCGRVSVYD